MVASESRDEVLKQMGVRRYAPLTQASVMEIAINLDADQVFSGDFSLAATGGARGTITIRGRLTDVRQLKRSEELVETGPLDDLSLLQARLCWRALRAAKPSSAMTEETFRQSHPPIRVDAMESYIRGLQTAAPEQKLRLFTNAVTLEPNYSAASFQLGRLALERKDYRAAMTSFQKVAATDPHHREALFQLGLSRFYSGMYKEAADVFSQLSQQAPVAEVLNNLAAAQSRTGDAGAVENFKKALETDPSDPDYYFNYGYALWRKGDFDQAAAQFRESLDRNRDDQYATLLVGRCLQKTGPQKGDARLDNLERVKTTYNDSAWFALKRLFEGKPHD